MENKSGAQIGTGWKSPAAHEQRLTRKIKRKNRALNLKNQVRGQKVVRTNFLAAADTNRSTRDSRDSKTSDPTRKKQGHHKTRCKIKSFH
jgi:hypothetical protein